MLNEIPSRQNEEANLKLLRAQRQVYRRVKRSVALQMFCTVLLPVGVAIAVIFYPDLKALAAGIAFFATIADASFLDRLQRREKKLAAKIQETFDCAVLALPWNEFTVGDRPQPESIHEAAEDYGTLSDARLVDWYPAVVGELPEHEARIICQRANLVYDASLRRRYGGWTLALSILIALGLFVAGLALRLPLDVLMLAALAPAVPVIVWGVREHNRQDDAAEASERLRASVQRLWDNVVTGRCSKQQCAEQSRLLQNAIFDRRASAPVIFEWVYHWLRPRFESQMQLAAEDLVAEAKRARANPERSD